MRGGKRLLRDMFKDNIMAQILVLYPNPPDIKAFDEHYFGLHTKLACRIPGLKRFEINHGAISSPQGPSPYHLIAQLNFGSMADLQAALASEESRIATADLVNFAPEGRRAYIFDTRVIPAEGQK